MQMMFQRAFAGAQVRRAGSLSRRGAFALEPVEALPRLAERISRLAERALEPNPFFLPEFLEPAIQALGRRGLKLAVCSDRDDLRFFAPVVATRGRLTGRPKLQVWTHPYAPLGAPLIDQDMAPQAAESLLEHMRGSGRRILSLPDMPLKGPAARALRAAAHRVGFWTVAAEQRRPVLHADDDEGMAAFERVVPAKRRKELDRQLRRLCDAGPVSMMTARTATEIDAAFGMFAVLEGGGWKGRRGTSLNRNRTIHEFARSAILQLAQQGIATIDLMRVGDRPVAALIRLEQSGLAIPWKIAFDEEFAAFSPGKQLMCDNTRRWLGDPAVLRVDPVCEEGNPLVSGLWRDAEPYGTLILSTARWGLGARVKAGILDMASAGKKQAKAMLRPRKATPKRASKGRKPARRTAAGHD